MRAISHTQNNFDYCQAFFIYERLKHHKIKNQSPKSNTDTILNNDLCNND